MRHRDFSCRSRGDNDSLWEKISLFIPPLTVNYSLMGLLSANEGSWGTNEETGQSDKMSN